MNTNVAAFLRAIRMAEGTADPDGYRRIVGGQLFTSYTDHPRKLVRLPRYGFSSSAAGAYQILTRTWDDVRSKLHLPDFSPASQDEAAVALIARRGALEDVKAGRIKEAVRKCNKEWASLPGSPYEQPTVRTARFMQEYEKYAADKVLAENEYYSYAYAYA